MLSQYIPAYLLTMALCMSCVKEDPVAENVSPDKASVIHLHVRDFFVDDSGITMDTPLINLPARLYYSEADALNDENLIANKNTDTIGRVSFYNLDSLQYTVIFLHPILGTKMQTMNTPPKSIVNQLIAY